MGSESRGGLWNVWQVPLDKQLTSVIYVQIGHNNHASFQHEKKWDMEKKMQLMHKENL